jgi:hypothetical protein
VGVCPGHAISPVGVPRQSGAPVAWVIRRVNVLRELACTSEESEPVPGSTKGCASSPPAIHSDEVAVVADVLRGIVDGTEGCR